MMAITGLCLASILVLGLLHSARAAPSRHTHKSVYSWSAYEAKIQDEQSSDNSKYRREMILEQSGALDRRGIIRSVVNSLVEDVHLFLDNMERDRRADIGGITLNCEICEAVISMANFLISTNTSTEIIKLSVNQICTSLKIETPRVCQGLIDAFAPELLTVLAKLIATPNEICGTFLDDCGNPYDPFNNWNVTLPSTPQPAPVPPVLPKEDSPTLRVLHLTDVHFDPDYKIGSSAQCGEPLCCRDGSGDGADGAGKFGDYRNCDTPLWTLQDLFATLADQSEDFDYIIWTGDVPAHNIWNQSREYQIGILQEVVGLIKRYLPGKLVYPSLGNHEGSPVNSFPPPYITGENAITWLYDALADSWKTWLPQDALETIRRGAYYTVSPYPGLRIISLNMNYCNNQNWWMLLNTTDPTGELAWLIGTLQAAEDANEKVHILGHIPPGNNDCLKAWSWNFYRIVSRYQNTIAGQFFGHTHRDQFKVHYDVETLKTPISVAYIGPSVTSYSNMNMGYRFYTIDGAYDNSSYQVLDHETYFLNLTKANIEGKTTWEFEYSAKAAYNMPSLFPQDWDNLINAMKTNNTLVQLFNKYVTKSIDSGACDDNCRNSIICTARSGRSHDPSFCQDLFKRDLDYKNMLRTEVKYC